MQLRRESKQIIDILKTFQTNTEDLIDLNKCKADDSDLDDVEEARETLEEQDLADDDDNSNAGNKGDLYILFTQCQIHISKGMD